MAAGVSDPAPVEPCLWAPRAWVGDAWAEHVLLRIGADGCWGEITADVAAPPGDATRLQGPALPGLVDAHSHAFQRAFAGLAERREAGREHDDFWSWRERMYAVAHRVTPAQLQAIAAHLFVELLRGGFTQVCEFHYLQHREDGSAYAEDPLALSWALADAAVAAGIGLTVLPVLYERSGFGTSTLRREQRRFALDAEATWAASEHIRQARRPGVDAGIAIHSLRAAAPASIARLRELAEGFDGPIHIHVAEQIREVQECLAATGARPVQWLADQGLLDPRWQLVHATHVTPSEIDAVAASGAGVVLCPSTEANLGDGLTDLPGWLAAGDGAVPLSIGSDSNVTRGWREELRWLEYGQRLERRGRNVAAGAEPGHHWASSAERLFQRALAGGGAAAGFDHRGRAGLVAGARADLLVVDPRDGSLLGVPSNHLLDALVFSSPGRPWRDVLVAGRWVVRDHRHAQAAAIAARFEIALRELWREAP
ncbi:MAG: formimidoylglutamate deiminase [Caldimonas sp.]